MYDSSLLNVVELPKLDKFSNELEILVALLTKEIIFCLILDLLLKSQH